MNSEPRNDLPKTGLIFKTNFIHLTDNCFQQEMKTRRKSATCGLSDAVSLRAATFQRVGEANDEDI